MSVTIEQKYEAAKRLINAQIDALSHLSNANVPFVQGMAGLTRGLLKEWLDESEANKAAYEALGDELTEITMAEIAAFENAAKQGYPNA